jgi:hypothetical protein
MKSAIFFAALNAFFSSMSALSSGMSGTAATIVGLSLAVLTLIGFAWATWSGERAAKRWIAQSRREYRAERIIRAARRGSFGY